MPVHCARVLARGLEISLHTLVPSENRTTFELELNVRVIYCIAFWLHSSQTSKTRTTRQLVI